MFPRHRCNTHLDEVPNMLKVLHHLSLEASMVITVFDLCQCASVSHAESVEKNVYRVLAKHTNRNNMI